MGRWKNTDTGEHRVTAPNSALDRKLATLPGWEPLDAAAEATDAAEPAKPKANANKTEWVDYAVARGVDRGIADATNRDDLVAMFAEADETAPARG